MKGPGNRHFNGRVKVLFGFFVLGMLGVPEASLVFSVLLEDRLPFSWPF